MPFSLKNTAIWRKLSGKRARVSAYARGAIALLLLALFTYFFPSSESIEETYHVGTIWTKKDLIAPFSFPIYRDSRDYERERAQAAESTPPVLIRDKEVEKTQSVMVDTICAVLDRASVARVLWLRSHSLEDSLQWMQNVRRLGFTPTDKIWKFIDGMRVADIKHGRKPFQLIDQQVHVALTEVYRAGVIDSGIVKQRHEKLAVRNGQYEEIVSSAQVDDLPEALMQGNVQLNGVFGENDTSALALNILSAVLTPNLLFNSIETSRASQGAIDNVPQTTGFVQEGERIIGKDERIDDAAKAKLDSFRRAKVERSAEVDIRTQRLGVFFHVVLIVGIYATYLFLFRKKIFGDARMVGLIAIVFAIVGFTAYLSRIIDSDLPIQFLIVVPAASMLLTIVFDSRVAFYGTVILAFLVAGIRGNEYSIAVTSLVAGALGAYTVRDIKSRTQIFRSIGFVFLGYALSIFALGLERFEEAETIGKELALAFTNSVASSVLAYAILIFFERVFHVTTDLTLLELSDFNSPLLQRLSQEAPGTFHHSTTIGNLAEEAADEIHANSILAKVGAYYHDVGKLNAPGYFVENQAGSQNRHSKLKPRMSARVIISHVTEGVELARENGIPENVIDFIPQHHGTTLISFFYDKALKQAAGKKPGKDPLREEDFRYPGPKPQSKETGIVMLADTVEATTRSLEDVSPQLLEQTIDEMVTRRVQDGQLDESPLTMKDIATIKTAFLRVLIGVYHQRIQYPDQPEAQSVTQEPTPQVITPVPSAEVAQPPVQQPVTTEAPVVSGEAGVSPPTEQQKTDNGAREEAPKENKTVEGESPVEGSA
jgi:hypothetical protein